MKNIFFIVAMVFGFLTSAFSQEDQKDMIVLKSGTILKVYNAEVGAESVFYQLEKGKDQISKIPKSEVLIIKKANGTKIDPDTADKNPDEYKIIIKKKPVENKPTKYFPLHDPLPHTPCTITIDKENKQVKNGDTLFVYEGYDKNIFTFKVLSESSKTLRVVDCVDKCGRCIFPDSVVYEGTTYTVTEIGPKVFNNGSVKEIVFPATLKVICDKAFGGLTTYRIELKSIILPEGLEKIGYKAFLNVRNVSELYIPQSVTSIGENAFKRCGIRRSPRGYYEAYISCLPQFVNDDNCTDFGIDDNALELYVKNLKLKLETIQQ